MLDVTMTTPPKKIEKIIKKIEDSGYKVVSDYKTVLRDETRNNFVATLEKGGKRFFFKTRLSPKEKFRIRIRREILFYQFLEENRAELRKFVPKFIKGEIGEIDYYITEFSSGENLGSRIHLDKNNIRLGQLSLVLEMLRCMATIEAASLIGNRYFEVRKSSYYKDYFNKMARIYAKHLEPTFVDRIERYVFTIKFKEWLDEEARTVSHGDFQAPNFIGVDKTLKVVDWDNVGIDNPLFDAAYFWAHSWRRIELRHGLVRKFLREDDRDKFLRIAVYLLFIQVAALRDFLRAPPAYAVGDEISLRQEAHDTHLKAIEKIIKKEAVL